MNQKTITPELQGQPNSPQAITPIDHVKRIVRPTIANIVNGSDRKPSSKTFWSPKGTPTFDT
jgi:hypothetical protein